MALPKEIKKVLDNMSAPALVSWLTYRHGEWHPIWEEVSEEEFDKHVSNPDDLKDVLEHMFDFENIYRRVPIYKDTGILAMMNSEPIGYRYEKQSGKEFVVLLGSDMMDYINSRKDLKDLI
jgi:hypothetical protein